MVVSLSVSLECFFFTVKVGMEEAVIHPKLKYPRDPTRSLQNHLVAPDKPVTNLIKPAHPTQHKVHTAPRTRLTPILGHRTPNATL
jgi:hypothetical protein